MDIEHVDLSAVLKRLCLATVARVYPEFEQRAAIEGWTHREFLIQLLSQEVAHRAETRVKKLTSGAHFPYLKTIEEFDFTFQNSIRRQQLGPFLGPEFVTEGRNLILEGGPGRGKTHIAIALAYRAIQNGFESRFVTATSLIDELAAALAMALSWRMRPRITHGVGADEWVHGRLLRASCAQPFGLTRLSAIPGSEFLGAGFLLALGVCGSGGVRFHPTRRG